MVAVFGPNGDAQPFISMLRSPLWLAEQSPIKGHPVHGDQSFSKTLAPLLLTMHGSRSPSSLLDCICFLKPFEHTCTVRLFTSSNE